MVYYSSIEPLYYILPFVGLIVGLFATAFGGGGGFFFLPILTLLLNVPTQTAVITSLVATLPIGFIGVYGHKKNGNISIKTGLTFGAFGIIGSFIGVYLASRVAPNILKDSFGVYTILLALHIIYKSFIQNEGAHNGISPKHKGFKSSIYGLCGGAISGSFGTSGTGPVLAGLLTFNLPLKLVIGTSLMVVSINALASISAHLLIGRIDLTLIIFLTAGSFIGALLGPVILSKTNTDKKENKARVLYALVLSAVGFIMIIG